MDKKDIECMEDGFSELFCEAESLKTLLDILCLAADYIKLSRPDQIDIFRALKTLANDLHIHIDDLQDNFLRLTKWSE